MRSIRATGFATLSRKTTKATARISTGSRADNITDILASTLANPIRLNAYARPGFEDTERRKPAHLRRPPDPLATHQHRQAQNRDADGQLEREQCERFDLFDGTLGNEMLDLARRNATDAGATNVTFLHGQIEQIPLPDATIDVSISNCVINLSTDKPAVFSEMHRVLRNGGRIGISDVVVDNDLDPDVVAEQAARIGCVAGALTFDAYQQQLANAGFANMTVTSTHELGEGLHSARIRATKA